MFLNVCDLIRSINPPTASLVLIPPGCTVEKAKQILLHAAGHDYLRANKLTKLVEALCNASILDISRMYDFEKNTLLFLHTHKQ